MHIDLTEQMDIFPINRFERQDTAPQCIEAVLQYSMFDLGYIPPEEWNKSTIRMIRDGSINYGDGLEKAVKNLFYPDNKGFHKKHLYSVLYDTLTIACQNNPDYLDQLKQSKGIFFFPKKYKGTKLKVMTKVFDDFYIKVVEPQLCQ